MIQPHDEDPLASAARVPSPAARESVAAPAAAHGHDEEARTQAELTQALAQRTPAWKPLLVLLVLALGAAGLVAAGLVPRLARREALATSAAQAAALARRVQIATPKLAPATRTLTLAASLEPQARADLYAQGSGYVRERRVDIGQHVKTGEVLAVLDLPLVAEQVASAKAALAEAEAARAVLERSLKLAQSTLERWRNVQAHGAVSQQQLDEHQNAVQSAEAAAQAGEASVAARRSELQRSERELAFSEILAPFDGTITARNVELGDYVSAGGARGTPLFTLADTTQLRAFVDVPQVYARGLELGREVEVLLREQPGKRFAGRIARTSGILDTRSRSLRVEIAVPNDKGEILAGAWGQVELVLARPSTPAIVPGAALLVRAEGPRIAIVDAQNKLHYVQVRIGHDLGGEIEIVEGLTGDERVVVNMADELPEGSTVDPMQPAGSRK